MSRSNLFSLEKAVMYVQHPEASSQIESCPAITLFRDRLTNIHEPPVFDHIKKQKSHMISESILLQSVFNAKFVFRCSDARPGVFKVSQFACSVQWVNGV